MRILFLGTCLFGEANNHRSVEPFRPLTSVLQSVDFVVLNMDGFITSSDSCPERLRSDGRQLLSIKKIIPHTPVLVNFKNNCTGRVEKTVIKNTENFLKRNNFLYSPAMIRPLIYGTVCIFNLIDLSLVENANVMSHVLPIQIEQPSKIFMDAIKSYKKPLRRIIVCLKWSSIAMNAKKHLRDFSEKLIDLGVDVVFGYEDSNSYNEDSYKYKNGIIMENLGDLINSSMRRNRVYAGSSQVCVFDTIVKEGYTIRINREIIDDNVLIPLVNE